MTTEISEAASKAFAGVCAEAARASAGYDLLEPGDRVLAALSGGLDSFVLLETLLYLQKRVPFEFTIQAVTFDPQFESMQVDLIAEYCRSRNVLHRMVSMDTPKSVQPCDICRAACPHDSRGAEGTSGA